MEESFELPVAYLGNEILLPCRLLNFGYTYKIEVEAGSALLVFERDEERNWRALMQDSAISLNKLPDQRLLAAIIDSLETVF